MQACAASPRPHSIVLRGIPRLTLTRLRCLPLPPCADTQQRTPAVPQEPQSALPRETTCIGIAGISRPLLTCEFRADGSRTPTAWLHGYGRGGPTDGQTAADGNGGDGEVRRGASLHWSCGTWHAARVLDGCIQPGRVCRAACLAQGASAAARDAQKLESWLLGLKEERDKVVKQSTKGVLFLHSEAKAFVVNVPHVSIILVRPLALCSYHMFANSSQATHWWSLHLLCPE